MTKFHKGLAFELDVKTVSETGEFIGYASIFGKPDLGDDVVLPGAFAASLKRRGPEKIKLLRQHDQSEPIGVWTALTEDKRGLKAEGRLILSTVKGRETYELLKAGALDGLSIGYKTIRDRIDAKKRVRFLEEIDLFEISVVTFPMGDDARVTAVKSDKNNRLLRATQNINESLKA